MEKLFFTFVLCICAHFVISQTVVSSCSAPDSIQALYLRDADRLALRKIYAQNLTYTNSIIIPQTHADTVLKALIAVYNATTLAARNTVISQYNIHTFPIPNIERLDVVADSNLAWMQQLKLGNIPTGNSQVDNLISGYYLTIQNYSNNYGIFSWHVVTFTSDSSYNLPPLADLFENISSVNFSEPKSVIGGGNDISASIYPNYVQLAYSLAWGDCPSGCIYRHYWTFNVYNNCSVEYLGESGMPLPIVSVPTISVSGLRCINQTLTVTISSAGSYSLNNQPMSVSQFTLGSPTPTSYIISASNYNYPASATTIFNVYILPVPAMSVTGTFTICNGETTTLTASGAGNYLWRDIGTTFSIVVSPIISTSYTLSGTNSNSQCTATQIVPVMVNPCTSISTHEQTEFLLYPNPVHGQLIIQLDVYQQIQLVNVLGQIQKVFELSPGENYCDVQELPSGIYFMRNLSGNLMLAKIIKD